MTIVEFEVFRDRQVRQYADAKVRSGQWRTCGAQALSDSAYDELLPDGVATAGKLLLVAELPDGTIVGWLFLGLTGRNGGDAGWIYNIEVDETQRGNGYGRALLKAAEDELTARGIETVELNVFADNDVALALYKSDGYANVAVTMHKQLRE